MFLFQFFNGHLVEYSGWQDTSRAVSWQVLTSSAPAMYVCIVEFLLYAQRCPCKLYLWGSGGQGDSHIFLFSARGSFPTVVRAQSQLAGGMCNSRRHRSGAECTPRRHRVVLRGAAATVVPALLANESHPATVVSVIIHSSFNINHV